MFKRKSNKVAGILIFYLHGYRYDPEQVQHGPDPTTLISLLESSFHPPPPLAEWSDSSSCLKGGGGSILA
jgi:hypothetical protein